MIHPGRCFFVTLEHLARAKFAVRHVIVGDEAWAPFVILIEIEAGLLRIDDNGVFLVRLHLQEVARYIVGDSATVSIGFEPGDRLVAQVA